MNANTKLTQEAKQLNRQDVNSKLTNADRLRIQQEKLKESNVVTVAKHVDGRWIAEDNRTWLQKKATEVLKKGPIPKHVAFILDGNRTYARSSHLKLIDGHREGMNVLANVMLWCGKFGVEEITAYIFSIENFRRPKTQVNDLMRLAKEAFVRLLNEVDKLNEKKVRVRVVGDWSMIPKSVISVLAKVQLLTKHNSDFTLNLAFVYTGRNEITRTAMDLKAGVESGELDIKDLNVNLMDEALKVVSTQLPLDMMFRTSGVTRLSDFMIWQSTFTYLHFTETLWPQLTFWDIWKSMFQYQVQMYRMKNYNIMPNIIEKENYEKINPRSNVFLENLENKYWDIIRVQAEKL